MISEVARLLGVGTAEMVGHSIFVSVRFIHFDERDGRFARLFVRFNQLFGTRHIATEKVIRKKRKTFVIAN